MKEDLTEKYNKYARSGKIDKLYNYIKENNLEKEFIQQAFSKTFRRGYEGKEQEEAIKFSNFALKVSMDTLTRKFGDKVTNKLAQCFYEDPYPTRRIINLLDLVNIERKPVSEQESGIIENMLNIASNKENVIGTHITGKENGRLLMTEGIELTGHKFAANDLSEDRWENHIRSTLDRNVTFFKDDPIGIFIQLSNSRGYNSPTGKYNDVMIVSIPKEELENDKEGIIIEHNHGHYLNPSYISGFVKVDVKNGNITEFFENPEFGKDRQEKDSVESLSVDDWKDKFESWYEEASTTKMQKIKNNVMGFFKTILGREKTEEKNDQNQGQDIELE